MDPGTVINWGMDWAWGLPLIVLTIVFHAFGLGFINKRIAFMLGGAGRLRNQSTAAIFVMGGTALWATLLSAFFGRALFDF
jgi:hypothetical protein